MKTGFFCCLVILDNSGYYGFTNQACKSNRIFKTINDLQKRLIVP